MRRLVVIIWFILAAFIVKSQEFDNLKPDASSFTDFGSGYKSKIREKLLADLSEFPIARAIVCPSFEPEFAVSIETKMNENGEGYDDSKKYLILRTCNPSIWNSFLHDNDSNQIFTKEILIDSAFSQTVENLFRMSISNARFSLKPTSGLDGTNYYFITSIMFEGIHCGYTWSPDSATKMFGLCEITELLRDYCETNDAKIKNEILNKSNALIEDFDNNVNNENQLNFERYLWLSVIAGLLIIIIVLFVWARKRK